MRRVPHRSAAGHVALQVARARRAGELVPATLRAFDAGGTLVLGGTT
jgi:hypothetical protein